MSVGRHVQSNVTTEVNNPAVAEHFGEQPHLEGEVVGREILIGIAWGRVLPRHSTIGFGEIHGVELLQVVTRGIGHSHYHIDALHRRTRRAVGNTASHGAGTLGESDSGDFIVDNGTVVALVLHSDAIVVINTWQGSFVGIEQVVVVARHAGQRLPGFVLLFGAATLDNVGLGHNGTLGIDVPGELHRAVVDALRGINLLEQRTLADGLHANGVLVELLIAVLVLDGAYDAIVRRLASIERLLGVGDARLLVDLVLTVGVLVSSAVLPAEFGLHVGWRDGAGRVLLVVHINLESVAEAFGITIRFPGEHDAVVETLRRQVIDGHHACGAHRGRGFGVIAPRILAPEKWHVIDIIDG